MIRRCFSEASESKKNRINELYSAINQAAIYGTIHFAVAVRKLIVEELHALKGDREGQHSIDLWKFEQSYHEELSQIHQLTVQIYDV